MKKAFSLIEVLVFTTVLSLFFVAAMTVTTFNLKGLKVQEHKILATRYAEEAVEWLKQEKEDSWSEFILHNSGSYCLNSFGWNSACAVDDYTLGSLFKRELTLTSSGSPVDQIETTLQVNWKEGSDDFNVKVNTVFRALE